MSRRPAQRVPPRAAPPKAAPKAALTPVADGRSSGSESLTAPQTRAQSPVLTWVCVALLTAVSVLLGLFEVFLVPWYVGSFNVPLSPVLAIAGNILLPVAVRRTGAPWGATVLPVVGWLLPVFVFGFIPRPEGDVVLPDVGSNVAIAYVLLFGGAAAGLVTLVSLSNRYARDRAASAIRVGSGSSR